MKVKENLEHILKELQDATFKIEEEQIENVLKLIAPDKKIFLTGKGRSGLAAKGFANRLMHLGFQAYVIGEISTPHTKAGDLLIITSGSGETDALVSIAKKAKEVGVELFVLDDGWFGTRNDDYQGLGDWFVNKNKLPNGISGLSRKIEEMGLKFGLWVELEMVNKNSDCYRAHPDWLIGAPDRFESHSRHQHVLDFSRSEVVDFIYDSISKVIEESSISYIKWDMNRYMSEPFSRGASAADQGKTMHKYILGVYELYTRLTERFPDILFESCASGGARFDPGMLYYSPQIWCSDDTDAIERLKIQHGTSMCYPCSAMGAHVSDCPNHTVGRNTPFKTRGHVAMVGTFGYELDVTRIPQEDRDAIPAQIEEFNKFNKLVRTGDHYRIGNMFEDNTWDAWEFVAKDKSEALFEFVQVLGRPNERSRRIKLKGLEADAYYYEENEPDKKISGAALMNAGINIAKMWNGDGLYGDFCSKILHFIKV